MVQALLLHPMATYDSFWPRPGRPPGHMLEELGPCAAPCHSHTPPPAALMPQHQQGQDSPTQLLRIGHIRHPPFARMHGRSHMRPYLMERRTSTRHELLHI